MGMRGQPPQHDLAAVGRNCEIPPVNTKERFCKHCGKKLSQYNLEKYCFNHMILGQVKEDERRDLIKYKENRRKKK